MGERIDACVIFILSNCVLVEFAMFSRSKRRLANININVVSWQRFIAVEAVIGWMGTSKSK